LGDDDLDGSCVGQCADACGAQSCFDEDVGKKRCYCTGFLSLLTTHGHGAFLGEIDVDTGLGSDIGPFGTNDTYAAALDPTDDSLYTMANGLSGNAELSRVDILTGDVTKIGDGVGIDMIALEINKNDGTMYGVGFTDHFLYEIDITTGEKGDPIGDTGIWHLMDLAFDSNGTLYGTANDRFLWTIDTSTGESEFYGYIDGVEHGYIMGIMFDPDDLLYATAYAESSPLYTVDRTTCPMQASIIGITNLHFPHGGDFGCLS
jgi:hypothetical protein